jgi:RHS repeat-associated protein
VKVTLLDSNGESLASTECSLDVPAGDQLVVASPASAGDATSYNVYVGTTSGQDGLQNSTPISLGTDFTLPSGGLAAGQGVPVSGVGDGNLTQTTLYPGGSQAPRITQSFFDWRDRMVASKSGIILNTDGTEDLSAEDDGTNRPCLYYTPNRDYSAALGTWMEQDPAGYVNGSDVYQAMDSSPLTLTDPSGLDTHTWIQPEITLDNGHTQDTPIAEIVITLNYKFTDSYHIDTTLEFRWHPLTNSGLHEAQGYFLNRQDNGNFVPITVEGPANANGEPRDQAATIDLGVECSGSTFSRKVLVTHNQDPTKWWWRIDVTVKLGDDHEATDETVGLHMSGAIQHDNQDPVFGRDSKSPYPKPAPTTKPAPATMSAPEPLPSRETLPQGASRYPGEGG